MRVSEIWSGGQAGVDRAAWDAARHVGISIRGWVPLGRRAEDGVIPETYGGLQETPSAEYPQRTTWNIRDTDATLVIARGPLHGGAAFTRDEAERQRKPVLVVDLAGGPPDRMLARLHDWLTTLPGTRLNVAGPRATSDPSAYAEARTLLVEALERLAAGEP